MRISKIARRWTVESLEQRCLFTTLFQNTQISSLPTSANEYGPTNFQAFGDDALFQATNPRTGRQAIWITDGSTSGTKPLPIPIAGSQLLVGTGGNDIYFAVTNVQIQHGIFAEARAFLEEVPAELYVTSDLGRVSRNLGRMPAGIGFGVSAVLGNDFFFTISGDASGTTDTLWETDGTRAGTHVINQVNANGYISSLKPVGNNLLVTTDSETITSLNVNSFQTQQIAAYPSHVASDPVLFGGYAYFRLNGDLARTDGTIQGTVDLYTGTANEIGLPSLLQILPVGNQLYLFLALELYTCSGAVNDIFPVAPVPTKPYSAAVAYDGQAVFVSIDDSGNGSLWHSDGTSAGTSIALPSVTFNNLEVTSLNLYCATADTATNRFEPPQFHLFPGQIYLLSNLPMIDSNLALQVKNVSLTDNAVGSAIKGSIQFIVSNTGGVVSTGPETLAIYFATDPAGDGLTLVKTLRLNLRVPAGSSRSIIEPLSHLPNQSPGNYFVFAQIIDSGQVLAQAGSATPVALTAGAALSNLSYLMLPNKSVVIRFEITDNANVPLSGTYAASVTYSDSTTSPFVLRNPEIKLLARPKHPQHVQIRVPAADLYGVSVKTGGSLTVNLAGIFAQTSITT